ncbi:MAG TPA: GIY-YIG nuclease family protein [Gaiellaceae bacterium]
MPPSDAAGFVYFVQRGADGPIKVGFSATPLRRIAQLQTSSAELLHVLATVPGGPSLERELHALFAKHRLASEWFSPHPQLFLWLAAYFTGRIKPRAPAPVRAIVREPSGPVLSPAELATAARRARETLAALPVPERTSERSGR